MEKFSYEKNGYKKSDVNKFIREVIKETEKLISIIKRQESKIDTMTKEIDHYKGIESKFNDALKQMEDAKESMDAISKKESDLIINEAKVNASRIVNRALIMAKEIDVYKEKYTKDVKNLKTILEQQKAIINEIENLKVE